MMSRTRDHGSWEMALGGRRRLKSSELELLVLALVADAPRHGYDLITALGERTRGFYVPSPGMVYPALARLAASGHVIVEPDGARKRYRSTEPGRAHLAANRMAVEDLFAQLERLGVRLERVRGALRAEERDGTGPAVADARRDLDAALAARHGSSAADQQRMAGILRRAAEEIRGGALD